MVRFVCGESCGSHLVSSCRLVCKVVQVGGGGGDASPSQHPNARLLWQITLRWIPYTRENESEREGGWVLGVAGWPGRVGGCGCDKVHQDDNFEVCNTTDRL